MKKTTSYFAKLAIAALAVGTFSGAAHAGTITGGTLLDNAGADQLEAWIGVGDQDFTNIWSGTTGASASSFHAAADGAGPTISIYDMTLTNGSRVRIGGYTTADWGANNWVSDASAFIFNLTTGEMQDQSNGYSNGNYSIYAGSSYFATFGGGHDIYGGYGTLGSGSYAYNYSWSYDHSQGLIAYAGDSGAGTGNSGNSYYGFTVNSLEVFTFADAQVSAVPLPAGGLLLMGALGTLAVRRKRKAS